MNIENIYDPGNDDTLVVQSIAHPNSRVTLFLRIRTFFRFIGAELSGGNDVYPDYYPRCHDTHTCMTHHCLEKLDILKCHPVILLLEEIC